MEVTVTFDVKNKDGSNFAKITAQYGGVNEAALTYMEGLLLDGFMKPLVEIAQAKAANAAA